MNPSILQNGDGGDAPKSIKFLDHQVWNLKYEVPDKSARGRRMVRGCSATVPSRKNDDSLEVSKAKPLKRVYRGKTLKASIVEKNAEHQTQHEENADPMMPKCVKQCENGDLQIDKCTSRIVENEELIYEPTIHDTAMLEIDTDEDSSMSKTNAFDFLMDRNKVISPNSKSPQTPTKKRMKSSPKGRDMKPAIANKTDAKSTFKISSNLYMSPKSKKKKRSKIKKPLHIDETYTICEDSEDTIISNPLMDVDTKIEMEDNVSKIVSSDQNKSDTISVEVTEDLVSLASDKTALDAQTKDSSASKPSFFDLLMSRDKPVVEKKQRKRKRTRRSGEPDGDSKRAKNSSRDSASTLELDDSDEECASEMSSGSDVPKSVFPLVLFGVGKLLACPRVSTLLSLKKTKLEALPEKTDANGEVTDVLLSDKSNVSEEILPASGVLLARNSDEVQTKSDFLQCPDAEANQPDENTIPILPMPDAKPANNATNKSKTTVVKSKSKKKKTASKSEDIIVSDDLKISSSLRRSTRQRQSVLDLATIHDECEDVIHMNPSERGEKAKRARKVAPIFERVSSSDSLTPPSSQQKAKNGKKVAPILDKPSPPILSPKSQTARLNFLHSGVPESLRQKQSHSQSQSQAKETTRSLQHACFTQVPHVQQRCSSQMWLLSSHARSQKFPRQASTASQDYAYIQNILKHSASLASCTNAKDFDGANVDQTKESKIVSPKKGAVLFQHCKQIVASGTKNFPVRYCFETFGDRNGLNYRPARRSKETSQLIAKGKPVVVHADLNTHTMWTKKYRPQCSALLRSNHESVRRLKAWLIEWQAVVREPGDDLFQSMSLLKNTMIVHGATGSGKSAAVYALCAELDVNVLEIHVSSRRSGKQLLQKVREATQSVQLGNHRNREARMCVILIDDADVVFAHDENFARDLHTLVTTSKRPIVLTARDTRAPHIARYANQDYPDLLFSGVSAKSMTTLLHILCLMEGVNVEPQRLGMLLEWNGGDIRRTLLHLQFWVTSGGDRHAPGNYIHWNCIRALTSHPPGEILLHPVDLGMLWWNLPIIVQPILDAAEKRDKTDSKPSANAKSKESNELMNYVRFLDSLSFCDSLNRTEGIVPGCVPHANRFELLETNETEPRAENYKTDRSLTEDLQHCLLELHCRTFVGKDDAQRLERDWLYSPPADARRVYSQQEDSFNGFQAAMPAQSGALDRQAFAQDYFPYLRELCRSGVDRQTVNPRRGNRGYNNLNSVGIYDIPPLEEKVARNMFSRDI